MSYSYFADYYDGLTGDVDYPAKAEYFLELCRLFDHKPGLTVDLACGTGSFTLELKKRGIDVIGADMSSDMLTQAQMKTSQAGESITFIRCKMQDFVFPGKIDTCVCTLDSVNHITSKKELEKAFCRINECLSDDGLFIFDANTVYKHREVLGDNCFIFDTPDVFCAWQNNYNEKNNRVIITLDFFEPRKGGYIRSSEQFSERAYTHKEMELMLGNSGLELVKIFDDMSFDEPKENSQREIYVVRKRKNEQ